MFNMAQDTLGIPRGTIRATVSSPAQSMVSDQGAGGAAETSIMFSGLPIGLPLLCLSRSLPLCRALLRQPATCSLLLLHALRCSLPEHL